MKKHGSRTFESRQEALEFANKLKFKGFNPKVTTEIFKDNKWIPEKRRKR